MVAAETKDAVLSFCILKDVFIAAPLDVAFEAILEELGETMATPDGKSMSFTLEAWPGGRWFRDLGEGVGHLWGHVQVIKPPTVLEICGPLFMSYACSNHVQYKLSEENGGTRLKLAHRAIGQILPEHQKGVVEGWGQGLERIRKIAESHVKA